jgi:hypothetical protein
MQWWREARFGMFIHWGVYSVPAGVYKDKDVPGIGEWIMNRAKIPVADYAQYTDQFNPTGFDAEHWVQIAQAAGMKYIVITAKHHDGFAMFHSTSPTARLSDAIRSPSWPMPARQPASSWVFITPSARTGIIPAANPKTDIGTRPRTAISTSISTKSPCRRSGNCSPTTAPSPCSGLIPRRKK